MSVSSATFLTPVQTPIVSLMQFLETSVDARLDELRLTRSSLAWPDVRLKSGEALSIPDDAGTARLGHRFMTTSSLVTFKQWIGFADEAIRDGSQIPGSFDLTGVSANIGDAIDEEAITTLARAYLFGDSSAVAHHRAAIEKHCAPFHVQLISARRLILEEASTLRLDTLPAILLVEEVILRGGSLFVSSGSHVTFGQVRKEKG